MRIELDSLPSFGQTFSAAALQAGRMKTGRGVPRELPGVEAAVTTAIDRARHAQFVHLVGDTVTSHVHPGYIHAIGFPLTMSLLVRKDFPLPLLGMLHITNQVTQTRGIGDGEELVMVASVENARPHYAGTLIDCVVRVSADGEEVLVDRSGYLVRGSDFAGERPERPERVDFVPGTPTSVWNLGGDTGRKYAQVSGDGNPIHLSKVSAKPFGFDRPIVHGMYSASRAYSATGVGNDGPRDWFVEFEAPVSLPGTVQFRTVRDGAEVSYEGWRAAKGDKPARRHFNGYVQSK